VALDIFKEKGVALDRQVFTWKDLVRRPYSKLDDDAFTRVRVILMNGIESDSVRFKHILNRMSRELREPLALVRRVEHHQQTMVNWLTPADQSPLETTLGFEQVAIEVTASVAQKEPDAYMAQAYRFGLLEDFDHLYRYAALYDRLEGKDPNYLIQSYSDIRPGRPTVLEHRHPLDDLRRPYDMRAAHPLTKIHALLITAAEFQTHDFYMTIGPMFADPVARQLYAEIASIEEQHVTQYGSLIDPDETMLEKWLLQEAMEVYTYYSCLAYETNPRVKEVWQRFVDYELGHLHYVMELFQRLEGRDPAEILPATLPEPVAFKSHREFVRRVLSQEVDLRANGTHFVDKGELAAGHRSLVYRDQLNSEGSPSDTASAGYQWTPGTELAARVQRSGVTPGGRLQS
jgi:rubrerythrin